MRNEYSNPLYEIAYHDTGFPHEHGASSTATKTPTVKPSATPTPPGGLGKDIGTLAVALAANQITYEQLVTAYGASFAQQVQSEANTGLSAEQKRKVADIKAQMAANPTATPSPVATSAAPASGPSGLMGDGNFNWTGAAPAQGGYGASPASAYAAIGNESLRSGSSSGSSSSGSAAAAPKVPPPPLRDSLKDLQNRGAVAVGGKPVLEGQQYAPIGKPDPTQLQPGEQFSDRWPDFQVHPDGSVGVMYQGAWHPLPAGSQEDSTATTQLLGLLSGVYQNRGPAITSNAYASIGNAALQGANRPRVSAGSGQDATVSLDNMIRATNARGTEMGDFLGSIQPFQSGQAKPLDIAKGAIPDYGGLRDVSDPEGNIQSFTGRTTGADGQEIAIGTGNTSAQDLLFQGLKSSDVARMTPEQMTNAQMVLSQMRQAGTMPDLGSLASQWGYSLNGAGSPIGVSGSLDTPFEQEYAKVMAAIRGDDPYALDVMPEPMAQGGSVYAGIGNRPTGGGGQNPALQMGTHSPMQDDTPTGGTMGRMKFYNGEWMRIEDYVALKNAQLRARMDAQQNQPSAGVNDIWRGLMADSDSWYTGPEPGGGGRPPRRMAEGGQIGTGFDWAPPGEIDPWTGLPLQPPTYAETEMPVSSGVIPGMYGATYAIDSGLIPGGAAGQLAGALGSGAPIAPEWWNPDPYKVIDPASYSQYNWAPEEVDPFTGQAYQAGPWAPEFQDYIAGQVNGVDQFNPGGFAIDPASLTQFPWVPPGMAQGGNIVTGNEPMTVVGQQTGNAYATIGEPNALTGGAPTKEVLNVTPMEPSVPMAPAPPQTPFSTLLEQLFPMRARGGRKA